MSAPRTNHEDAQNPRESLKVSTQTHGCPMPRRAKRYTNRLWICNCGAAWRSVKAYINYASGPVYQWERWRP